MSDRVWFADLLAKIGCCLLLLLIKLIVDLFVFDDKYIYMVAYFEKNMTRVCFYALQIWKRLVGALQDSKQYIGPYLILKSSLIKVYCNTIIVCCCSNRCFLIGRIQLLQSYVTLRALPLNHTQHEGNV